VSRWFALVRSIPFVAIVIAAGYFYALADRIEFDGLGGRIGPNAWPKIVLGLMIAVAVLGIVKAFFAPRETPADLTPEGALSFDVPAGDIPIEAPSRTWLHLPILGTLLFVGYVLVLDIVGFVVATGALIAAFLYLGRYRHHVVIAACSVLGPLAFFIVFRTVAYVSLPLGKGPFLDFSVWLMKLFGIA
jgi:putative tricarboxylic transport membrane protein